MTTKLTVSQLAATDFTFNPSGYPLGYSLGTNGLWTALTYSRSRQFKTERGARRWFLENASPANVERFLAMFA